MSRIAVALFVFAVCAPFCLAAQCNFAELGKCSGDVNCTAPCALCNGFCVYAPSTECTVTLTINDNTGSMTFGPGCGSCGMYSKLEDMCSDDSDQLVNRSAPCNSRKTKTGYSCSQCTIAGKDRCVGVPSQPASCHMSFNGKAVTANVNNAAGCSVSGAMSAATISFGVLALLASCAVFMM